MTEALDWGGDDWANWALKFAAVTVVFPVLVSTGHTLFAVPALPLALILARFAGHPIVWAKMLSILSLVLACWGALAVCKSIWPKSK